MNWHTIRIALASSVAAFALFGCATTGEMDQPELRSPTPNDGVVIGSVWIRGGKDLLGRTRWELAVDRAERKSFGGSDYSIQAHRDGAEEVFAITMPAGRYRIPELRQPGFSTFRRSTDFHFEVRPGKTTYIGRLLIEFPQETISVFTPIKMTIEDARDGNVAEAQAKYRRQFQDVSTQLMVVGAAGVALPGKSTADARLEKDTLFLIMGMDRAEDPGCNQRRVANREIVSADSGGAIENWTLDRCGTLVRYGITYRPNPKGGTNLFTTPGVAVGKAQSK